MKPKINYKKFHFIIIFIILFILLVCLLRYWNTSPKLYYYNNMEFKEYYATSPYADVRFKANDHVMYITVKYKKLKEKNDYMQKMFEDQKKENEKLAKKLKEIESVTKKGKK